MEDKDTGRGRDGEHSKHSLFSSLPGTLILGMQFLVQLCLFLWNCMGKFSSITQSCLCFLKKPVERMGSSSDWTAGMFLCYLSVAAWPRISRHFEWCSNSSTGSRLFPFHGAYQGGKGLVPAVPAESSNSAFSTHPSMEVKNQTPFDKMFCLLVIEKKAKYAGTASKSELWELLRENQDTRVQATQQIHLQNTNWEADTKLNYHLQLLFPVFFYVWKWRENPKTALENFDFAYSWQSHMLHKAKKKKKNCVGTMNLNLSLADSSIRAQHTQSHNPD